MPNCLQTFDFTGASVYDLDTIRFYYNGSLVFTLEDTYASVSDMLAGLSSKLNSYSYFVATPSSTSIDIEYSPCQDCQSHTYTISRTGLTYGTTTLFTKAQMRAIAHYGDFFYWVSFLNHELYTSDDTALDKTVALTTGIQPVDVEIVNNGGTYEVWVASIDSFAGPGVGVERYTTADPPVVISNHTYGASGIVVKLKYDPIYDWVYGLSQNWYLIQIDSGTGVANQSMIIPNGTSNTSLAVSSVTGNIAISNTIGEVYVTDNVMSAFTLIYTTPTGDPIKVYDINGVLWGMYSGYLVKIGSYGTKPAGTRYLTIKTTSTDSTALTQCDNEIVEGSTTDLNFYGLTGGLNLNLSAESPVDIICVDGDIYWISVSDAKKLDVTTETINYTDKVITDCSSPCDNCDRIKTPIDHSYIKSCDVCGDCQSSIFVVSKNDELPSFQFFKDYSPDAITSWSLMDICNNQSIVLTPGDLEVCNVGKCDVISYLSTAISPPLDCSVYKSIIVADGNSFESCPFKVVDDVTLMITLEWWDDHNIGGRFYTGGYVNKVYIDERVILDPATYEDEGSEDGEGTFIPLFKKRTFPYRIHTLTNTHFAKVLFDIQLHSKFRITEADGTIHEPDDVDITLDFVETSEGQCTSQVNIRWEYCERVAVSGCENNLPVGVCISNAWQANAIYATLDLTAILGYDGERNLINLAGVTKLYEFNRSTWKLVNVPNYTYVGISGTSDFWLFRNGEGDKMGDMSFTRLSSGELLIKAFTPLGSWNEIEVDTGAGYVSIFTDINQTDLEQGVETTTLSATATCGYISFRITSDIKSGTCTYQYDRDYYYYDPVIVTVFADEYVYCSQNVTLPHNPAGGYLILVLSDPTGCSSPLSPYENMLLFWWPGGVTWIDVTPNACTLVDVNGKVFVYTGTEWQEVPF